MTKTKAILKKSEENLGIPQKYRILHDYIYSNLTNAEIADKYGTTKDVVSSTVSFLWKDFQQIKETKALVSHSMIRANSTTLHLDPTKVNQEFLEQLSGPEDHYLTDPEVIYCELYNANGDDLSALIEAGLHKGLKKPKVNSEESAYRQALALRSFYLRRKPNIVAYLKEIQQKKLTAITDGKAFIQVELLKIIEKLNNSEGDRNLASRLKAIELAARTFGALEDKLTVEEVNGDSALDKILKRAKQAKESSNLIESNG